MEHLNTEQGSMVSLFFSDHTFGVGFLFFALILIKGGLVHSNIVNQATYSL